MRRRTDSGLRTADYYTVRVYRKHSVINHFLIWHWDHLSLNADLPAEWHFSAHLAICRLRLGILRAVKV